MFPPPINSTSTGTITISGMMLVNPAAAMITQNR
jgi:hypothetical protein